MNQQGISEFLNKHCRIKFRSGKDVYGIVWEIALEGKCLHYFTSASLKENIESSSNRHQILVKKGIPISLEDILLAECIVSEE